VEALRKCKAKFPGRQLVYVSRNWGFTPFEKSVFTDGRQMTQTGTFKQIFLFHSYPYFSRIFPLCQQVESPLLSDRSISPMMLPKIYFISAEIR
jgi:hypothetical protein